MSEQRIQDLETVVRALRDEVGRLRAEVQRLGGRRSAASGQAAGVQAEVGVAAGAGAGSPVRAGAVARGGGAEGRGMPEREPPIGEARGAPPNGQFTPRDPPVRHRISATRSLGLSPRDEIGLEALVGRYGTLALAAVLVVMGVGAFVTWAATRFAFGPEIRVALGAIAALALAVLGRRIAMRGAVAFGHTILALALAVAHVDAWAAGPVLHVVPNLVALGAAAVASMALAALALRERNETLFAVGVGGAVIAPFVTGDRESSVILLLSYGWVVLASALAASGPRNWRLSSVLMAAGAVLYVVATIDGSYDTAAERAAVAGFPLACAWAAHLWGSARHRAAVSLGLAALAAVPLAHLAGSSGTADLIVVAVVGTVSAYVFLELRAASLIAWIAGAVGIPLAFLFAAVRSVDASETSGALLAAGWAAAALLMERVSRERTALHLTTASFALVGAVVLALQYQWEAMTLALSAAALVIGMAARYREALAPLLAGGLALAIGFATSQLLLVERGFVPTPFLTSESAAALCITAAAYGVWQLARRLDDRLPVLLGAAFGGALFLWLRTELAHAVRMDVATFLLILYYGAFGAGLIALGRRREVGALRLTGMALALYAAVKAIVQASGLTMIGLRVGSYLLVGGFLLAVAYWYRAGSGPPSEVAPEG
jgi:hypothetical protein